MVALFLHGIAWGQFEKKELRVRTLLDKGRPYKAATYCERALSIPGAPAVFHVLRATAYNDIAKYPKAVIDARAALVKMPGDRAALVQLGIAELGMDHVDSAYALLRSVVEMGPDEQANMFLAGILLRRNDPAAALEVLDQLMPVVSRPAAVSKVERTRGEAMALLGDTLEAHKAFDRAISILPKDPVAYNSRGWYLYALQGMHEQAIRDYDRAIKLDLNYSFAFNNRGWSRHRIGQTEKGLKDIRNAINRSPNNAYAYRNLGMVQLDLGQADLACQQFRTALEKGFTLRYGDEMERALVQHCGYPAPRTTAPAQPPVPPSPRP
jgi:tetratricopeptide (TPR) repeat protein